LNDLKNRAKFDVVVLHLQVNPSIPKSCTYSYFWHEFLGIPAATPPSPQKDISKLIKDSVILKLESRRQFSLGCGIICKGCAKEIQGIRYKCNICADYNLCAKCEETTSHDSTHAFLKIKSTSTPLECGVCKRKFATQDRLKQHQADSKHDDTLPSPRSASNVDDKKKFSCFACGQEFTTRESLTQHRSAKGPHGKHISDSGSKENTPERGNSPAEFKCICGKSFLSELAMAQHQQAKNCHTDLTVLSSLSGLLQKLIY